MSTTQDPIVLDDSTSNPYVHQDDPRIDDENRSNEEFQTSKRQKSIDNREPKVERTKTAEVWNEFEKVQKNGVTKARCNHYGSLLEYNKQRTTTSMSRHLKFHCQKRKLVMKKQGILNFQPNGSNVSSSEPALAPAIVNGKYDHMRMRESIPHWILMHEHSFFIVEEAGFDFMMKVGIPQWPGLSRASAKNKKWKLNKWVLNFVHFPPPHRGIDISEALYEYFQEWDIENKIYSILMDNTSSNDNPIKDLRRILESVIKNVRDSISFINASEARTKTFNDLAQQMKLPNKKLILDCKTRWNSTYEMLSSAYKFKEVFPKYRERDIDYESCPLKDDWVKVE
ncbi:zinc finger BED domain-containing protein RICESLEEPER 2-like protein [Tanacetum coccineum]